MLFSSADVVQIRADVSGRAERAGHAGRWMRRQLRVVDDPKPLVRLNEADCFYNWVCWQLLRCAAFKHCVSEC